MRIVRVFGSYVRQEQRPDSDLDLLIELGRPPRISLIGLVELEDCLSQVLGVKVDLAINTNLKKRIGARVLQEVIYFISASTYIRTPSVLRRIHP